MEALFPMVPFHIIQDPPSNPICFEIKQAMELQGKSIYTLFFAAEREAFLNL